MTQIPLHKVAQHMNSSLFSCDNIERLQVVENLIDLVIQERRADPGVEAFKLVMQQSLRVQYDYLKYQKTNKDERKNAICDRSAPVNNNAVPGERMGRGEGSCEEIKC